MSNLGAKPAASATSNGNTPAVESCRNFWIYTGYAGAALALLGALAYHFSSYVMR